MGTLSGDGYYQDLDEARGWDEMVEEEARERAFEAMQEGKALMQRRFADNARAEMGATIECACCGRKVVKKHYQQKFCPPTGKGKSKRYRCKDKYHNITNPRGMFAHLA